MEGSRITLSALTPPFSGREWQSETILRVGRVDTMEVVLNVPSVSRRHAEILITPEGWVVRDLGSMNGSFLNGVRVGRTEQRLRQDDAVVFGDVTLKVKQLQEKPPAVVWAPPEETKLKTSGPLLRVQAVSQNPWEQAIEALALHAGSRHEQRKGFLTLLRTGYHLCHIASLEELLKSILGDAVAALNAQHGAIVLADEITHQLHAHAVLGHQGPADNHKGFSATLALRCYQQGESLLCQDAGHQMTASMARDGMASVICTLLRTPRKHLGVLHLDRGPLQEPFDQEDFCLADAIAANVSVGIECAQLMKRQLDQSIHTVTALAQAVELRDRYTGGHTHRVTSYALMLARELKLPPHEQHQLQIGTPLHDIGKIGIDDAILRKPGRLTREEFEEMKSHTLKGAAILESIPELSTLLPIVRSHHERWDGTGYPDNLAGDRIPRPARLVAVADAFDAMTSDRPYRNAMTFDQVFQEYREKCGTHFDPDCVHALLRLRPHLEALLAQEGSLRKLSDGLAGTFLRKEIQHLADDLVAAKQ
jgi:HD-GYP domain-containing protein (c-di-GMP phosphodiesterase class II)/pSer/pThr/pTyr-binding forkhead associated (FHA) protein